jgi:hypothetical protein
MLHAAQILIDLQHTPMHPHHSLNCTVHSTGLQACSSTPASLHAKTHRTHNLISPRPLNRRDSPLAEQRPLAQVQGRYSNRCPRSCYAHRSKHVKTMNMCILHISDCFELVYVEDSGWCHQILSLRLARVAHTARLPDSRRFQVIPLMTGVPTCCAMAGCWPG